jgi:hypothetical protein
MNAISLLQAVIKQAEGTLKTLQSHPGFGIAVLKVGELHIRTLMIWIQ